MATIPDPSSAVAGYLPPQPAPAPVPKYGDELLDLFHDTIAGITGITGSLVRPRWQADPPNQPGFDTNWVSFGIVSTKGDWNPWQQHDPALNDGFGGNVFERDEVLILLHSFYGPRAQEFQSMYQDGLLVDQNRTLLDNNGIKLIELHDSYNIPALLKQRWVTKVDQRVTFRRRIRRIYPILNLVSAVVEVHTESFISEIIVQP